MGKEKLPVHARSRCHEPWSKSQVRHPNHRIPWGFRKLKGSGRSKKNETQRNDRKKNYMNCSFFPFFLYQNLYIHIRSQVFQKPSGCLWFLWERADINPANFRVPILGSTRKVFTIRLQEIFGAGILLEFGLSCHIKSVRKGRFNDSSASILNIPFYKFPWIFLEQESKLIQAIRFSPRRRNFDVSSLILVS